MKVENKWHTLALVLVCVLFLSSVGCASIPFLQSPQDKIDPAKPTYSFMGEVRFDIEGLRPMPIGLTSTRIKDQIQFSISSPIPIKKVYVRSCNRSVEVDPKKPIVLKVLETEMDCMAGILIHVIGTQGQSDWGYIALSTIEDMPTAKSGVDCNGMSYTFREGYTTCQAMVGTIQRIRFDNPIPYAEADPECNMKRLNDKSFEFRPKLGECTAAFSDGVKKHSAFFMGYEREAER